MEPKRVVVTGASGLLGREVLKVFTMNHWVGLGLAHSRVSDPLVKVDLTNVNESAEVIKRFKPHVIVHCAAERSLEKVEMDPAKSRSLNVYSSRMLADLAGQMNVIFIYISTDYVFDGENPPYREDDLPNPLNEYGRMKYEGEKEVMRVNPGSCILRIPVLYGGELLKTDSAIALLIDKILGKTRCTISNWEVRFPSHTNDIATICFELVTKKLEDQSLNSVFHWCGSEPLTKYEMAKTIAEVFSVSHSHIEAYNGRSAGILRPRNSQLSCERLKSLGISQHTLFRNGVRQSFASFFK